MKHILITGAGGFVGQALVQRLLQDGGVASITAIDQRFAAPQTDPRVRQLEGNFGAAAQLDEALRLPPDSVFHLASVPGSLAEREPALGLQVNLLATINLFQRLGEMSTAPRVVFASSIAVYGALPPEGRVDEDCPALPALSYGAHKLMSEILLADLSRRGQLDGISLRLPGIVARPLSPTGHGSAFMSDLIRVVGAGQPYVCPVSPQAQAWWMSLPCCIDNLLHAAGLPKAEMPAGRCIQLPVLTATVADVVATLEALSGQPAEIEYQPDARIEALFGRLPTLDTPRARQLGFGDDGSLKRLIRRATVLG